MPPEAIDSAYVATPDLAAACRPYERLGLMVSPPASARRTLHVGDAGGGFRLHFVADPVRRGLVAVGLRVRDLEAALAGLAAAGITSARPDGQGETWVNVAGRAGTDVVLVRAEEPAEGVDRASGHRSPPDHRFPLRRLDHLAAVTHDLEAKTRFWSEAFGVTPSGEVTTPAMVIRQFRVGDAVLELLGPAGKGSPIWGRPEGLVSMASWEVPDLDAAAGLARSAGFSVTDPAAGPLPGTRIATVAGAELAGVNMQLLQYV